MKLEAGKFYRTRSGILVGPLKVNDSDTYDSTRFPFIDDTSSVQSPAWTADGRWMDFNADDSALDLVEEARLAYAEPVNEAPHTLTFTGTKEQLIEAFFAVPPYLQEQVLGALLDRVSGR